MKPGTAAVLVGVALLAGYTGVTAATAPPIDVGSEATASGPTLVGSFGQGYDGTFSRLDADGERTWRHGGAVSFTSVHRLDSGNVLVGYQDKRDGHAITGVRIVTPDNQTDWDYNYTVATGRNSEVHDAEPLPNGNILVAGMDRERVFIVDRESRRIVWQWNASSHYVAPENPRTRDWLHINDVDRIGDDRYLVSVRNANQLLIVHRKDGVVDVINRDESTSNDENCQFRGVQLVGDDPKCGDPDVLNHQHNPQWLGEGAVLVADSENDRIVELHETKSGDWEVAWAASGAGGIAFDWPRDADRLPNGETLILDTRNNRLVQITQAGRVTWSARIPEQSYAAVRNGSEYPSGPRYTTERSVGAASGQPFESIETLYGAIRYTLPLPYYITSWHVLVGLAAVVIMALGTGENLRERLREYKQTHE